MRFIYAIYSWHEDSFWRLAEFPSLFLCRLLATATGQRMSWLSPYCPSLLLVFSWFVDFCHLEHGQVKTETRLKIWQLHQVQYQTPSYLHHQNELITSEKLLHISCLIIYLHTFQWDITTTETKKILNESSLNVIAGENLTDAAQKIIAAIK